MLLKIKILIDVMNIRIARQTLNGNLNVELWSEVETAVARSAITKSLTGKSSVELVGIEGGLVRKLRLLGSNLRKSNDNVITGVLQPDEWLALMPYANLDGLSRRDAARPPIQLRRLVADQRSVGSA